MYYRFVDRTAKNWSRFDPNLVNMITKLVKEFSAKLSISSTWRFSAIKQLDHELAKPGLLKYLYKDWKTPQAHPSHRGTEINMWLDTHPDIKDYVIIVDEDMLDENHSKFVRTALYEGMREEHYNKSSEIL